MNATTPGRNRRHALGGALVTLAAGVAAASALGPLATGAIRYRTSATSLNQIAGGDLAGLVLVAPVALIAGLLLWRGHRAGPALALAPALWAAYMYAQLLLGQEYLRLPGNNERFFPLLLGLFVLAGTIAVIAWRDTDTTQPRAISRRLERTTAAVLLAIAAFLVLGLHLPSLLDAMRVQPTAVEYTSSPTAFWVVKVMDLGIVVPAAVATGVGLLRRRPWAGKACYAILGGYTLLSASVTGMAVVMYLNNDPDRSLTNVVAFAVFTATLAYLTTLHYRPLLVGRSPAGPGSTSPVSSQRAGSDLV
jgi:hypothetical protein